MNFANFQNLFFAAILFTFSVAPQVGRGENLSLWLPGYRYNTRIAYTISIDNAEIYPGKKYDGRFVTTNLSFNPVIEFTTEDIVTNGLTFVGKRYYGDAINKSVGLKDIKWKSNHWRINPERWWEAIERIRDPQLKELYKSIKDDKKGVYDESFDIFFDSKHNAIPFNSNKDIIFSTWTTNSIPEYFNGNDSRIATLYFGADTRGNRNARIPTADMSSQDFYKHGCRLPLSHPGIRDVILSEFNLLASAIFDDPSGKSIAIPEKRNWNLDAGLLNGLLASSDLQKLISFKGNLRARWEDLSTNLCNQVGVEPFAGIRVIITRSKDATIGYDTGNGYVPFPVTISPDGRNKIEFWFDREHEMLRYARVHIECPDYNGNIPNPMLGKMLSSVKGHAEGNVTFDCTYHTRIERVLDGIPSGTESRP